MGRWFIQVNLIVPLLVFLAFGGQAQQRVSELEISDRLSVGQLAGIRLDLLELVSIAGLPKSGIVLGWGADLLALGGNVILQHVPNNLIQDLVAQALEPQLQVPGLSAGTYHYLLTVLLDDYEILQQSPVKVNVGDRGRVEIRWRVNPQFVRLQRFNAKIGFRIYRTGPGQEAFASIKELLNPVVCIHCVGSIPKIGPTFVSRTQLGSTISLLYRLGEVTLRKER